MRKHTGRSLATSIARKAPCTTFGEENSVCGPREKTVGLSRSRIRAVAVSALSAAIVIAAVQFAPAASCINFLAVGEATVRSAPDGSVMDMVGVWEFDNIMQVELGLSLNALVFQGDDFVRFPLLGPAESGTFAGLSDGLSAGDLPALEASGVSDPDAEVLTFRAHKLQLSLPPTFTPGVVSVVMYLVQDGEYQSALLSNTLSTQF